MIQDEHAFLDQSRNELGSLEQIWGNMDWSRENPNRWLLQSMQQHNPSVVIPGRRLDTTT